MDIYSKIDSNRFGIKVGKIDVNFFDEINVKEGVEYFIKNKFDLIITRLDFEHINLINTLENNNFTLGDIQTALFYLLKDFDISKFPERTQSYKIREFKESDTDTLVNLTKLSFNDFNGHYFRDKNLDINTSLEAYEDWIYNVCTNSNLTDKIWVSEKNNEIAGYTSVKILNRDGKNFGNGVLGAVSPKHRGMGIFQDLAIKAMEWSAHNGCEFVEHNVLVNNYPVVKSYTRVGFKPHKVMVTLHGWVNGMKL